MKLALINAQSLLSHQLIDLIKEKHSISEISLNCDTAKNGLSTFFTIIIGLDLIDADILETIKQLKENNPLVPIIVISGALIEKLGIWCLRNRMWDYIILPNEEEYLLNTIKALSTSGSYKQMHNDESIINNCISFDKNIIISSCDHRKTQKAIDYIHENFYKSLRNNDLARVCNLGIWTFSSYFKTEHSITPSEYIMNYRVEIAKSLLTSSNNTMQQISYAVGYDDPSYFSRVFKRIAGLTPKEYREEVLMPISDATVR